MGDHIGVYLPVQETYLGLTNHPGQLSLAIPLWRNEYRPIGCGALQLGSKGRYGSCLVAGKTV